MPASCRTRAHQTTMADADAVAKKAAIEALLFSPTPSEEQAQREEPRRTSESDLAALQASLGVVDRESRPRSTARSRRRSQARQRSLSRSRIDEATVLASKEALQRDVEALEEGPRRRRERIQKRPSRTPSPKTELQSESPTERVIKTMPGSPRAEDKATFSVVLIGAKGSGKTVACRTYARGFSELRPAPTLGVEAYMTQAPKSLKGLARGVKIWDTSGDDRFSKQTHQLVKVADAVLVLYNRGEREAFADATNRLLRATAESPPNAIVVLVATSLEKSVDDDVEARDLALSAGADFRTLRVADRTAVTSLFRDVLLAAGGKRRLARPVLEDTELLVSSRAREVLCYGLGLVVLFLVVLLDA